MRSTATLRSLLAPTARNRALHLSWVAFFFCFAVWFDFAPFAATIGRQLHLSAAQHTTLGLCNLALTVPARVGVGAALDRFGPRRVFPALLVAAAVPNTIFATATTFPALVWSRLALSVVGAGFVVGIRMVSEWWPEEEIGAAEGVYGGWGNLGAGAATVGLPIAAAAAGGSDGWRWATAVLGIVAAAWGILYLVAARDTPDERWVSPRRQGALEVTTRAAVFGLAGLGVPVFGVLAVVAYEVRARHVISAVAFDAIVAAVALGALAQAVQVFRVNRPALAGAYPPSQQYPFRSVAGCCASYMVTFGGELAVLSILPAFYAGTWHLGVASAGVAAGTFGLMNLVTRPGGGIASDVTGRRRTVLVVAVLGAAAAFGVMSTLEASWPAPAAVAAGLAAAAFLQAANGACFAVVPRIHRAAGGQIAGLVGAYGNIGGILLLFLGLHVRPQGVFLCVAAGAVAAGLLARRLIVLPGAGVPVAAPRPLVAGAQGVSL